MVKTGRAEALHDAAMIVRAQATTKCKATTEELIRHLRSKKTDKPGYADGITEAIEEISNAPPETDCKDLANRIDQRALQTLNQ